MTKEEYLNQIEDVIEKGKYKISPFCIYKGGYEQH